MAPSRSARFPTARIEWSANEAFVAALEKEEHERESFLAEVTGSDVDLRREVESMLTEAGELGDFLQKPAMIGIRHFASTDATFHGNGRRSTARESPLRKTVQLSIMAVRPKPTAMD